MTRRILVFGLFLLMITGAASASDLVLLDPLGAEKAIKGPVASGLDELDEVFYLQRFTSDAEYYLGSGDLGDTMCVVFQPLAACSIKYAEQSWFAGGNFQSFIWDYSAEAEAEYPDGRSVNRGTATVSPLGDVMFGPYNNASTAEDEWEPLFTQEDLPGGGIWMEEPEMFVVGYVKTAEGGTPNPLADDVSGRRFTYTWFCGPWTEGAWGAYSSDIEGGTVVDMLTRVAVTYPNGAPPIIGPMNQLPNTVNANKECTVTAEIIDDNGWTTDTATLLVSVNGGDATEYAMEQISGTNDFSATFTIDAAVGDVISYYIEAVDDEGGENSNVDEQLWFDVVELGQDDASFLMVDHGSATWANVNYWAWENGLYFQFWDAGVNKGIDEFTVNQDWDAVFILGWGASTVPTRSTDNAYQAYAEGGGNLFFSDMDYFYANGEDVEPTFESGDFCYDVFGIAGGLNDPAETDSVYYGEPGDAISGDFVDDGFTLYPNVWTGHWADGVTGVDGASNLFVGEDFSINGGISYENSFGGKAIYLGFDVLAAVDPESEEMTDQFATLMGNIFGWFSVTSTPETGVVTPSEYALDQNYPNPFNPTTQITFAVPQAGNVSVKVFNMNGQVVATLFQGQMAAGNKSVTFDASQLASGVYFYRMEANGFSATRKMMLVK
ncbi:T9SS type A sorting domain-containing protein [bacterium]|nr:T9SS type A sorting domain-containing protein [bacterium]